MTSEAQKRASKKYFEKLEMISIRLPKGEPELFKEHAKSMGESLAKFIERAAKETIERDNNKK